MAGAKAAGSRHPNATQAERCKKIMAGTAEIYSYKEWYVYNTLHAFGRNKGGKEGLNA